MEDCFRKAIQKHGVPEAVYFDNGKQYKTKWMTTNLFQARDSPTFCKTVLARKKGKVERLNGVIGSFLNEVALEKPKTLEQLNTLVSGMAE